MCGIHGIIRFDGVPVERALLAQMGAVTAHRGPDDEGWHIDGPCGIAMRRLSIIDLAGGHQPISNADDTIWLVCNGEIYNFRELRAELQAAGYRFKTGSDSEVLVHLYAAHGESFVEKIEGMFAFALWDARRKRLLVGRDHLGVKPLYVYRGARMLAFSTEAKALLELPDVGRALDTEALADYLHLGYVAAPRSMFRGIGKLPPATVLTVEEGRVSERRFWQVPSRIDRRRSESEWTDLVRARMQEAVRMQMVSDVPIGAFLSGGVDSSAVVAFMARHSDRPVKTYAIGFEGGEAERLYNELPYARQVANLFGTEHHEILVRPDVVALLPRLLWHMDEPIADSAFVTTYLVSEFAHRDVKVILSGVGGDELFGGYRRYLGERYARWFAFLPPHARRAVARCASALPSDRHSTLGNRMRLARGLLESVALSPDERYRHHVQVLGRAAIDQLLAPGVSRDGDALAAAFAAAGSEDTLARLLAVDAATQLPDDLLLLTDKMSMAVSLECRVPLLDRGLVELAASIPQSIKIKGGGLKYLMKASLREVLPRAVLEREKRGFGTPMGAWIKGDLAPVLRATLSDETLVRRGLFAPAVVRRLIDEHFANRVDGTDALLSLMNLEIWSRMYLDGRSAEDVALELKSLVR